MPRLGSGGRNGIEIHAPRCAIESSEIAHQMGMTGAELQGLLDSFSFSTFLDHAGIGDGAKFDTMQEAQKAVDDLQNDPDSEGIYLIASVNEVEVEISGIKVRRHNGQNAYGPWIPAENKDVPEWVREYAEEEQIEENAEEGRVEKGGSIWIWSAK